MLACLIALTGCGGGGGGGDGNSNSPSTSPSYLIITDRDPVPIVGTQSRVWDYDATIRSNSHNVEVLLVSPGANPPSNDAVSQLAAANNPDTRSNFVAVTRRGQDYLAFGTRYTRDHVGGTFTYTGEAFTNFGDGRGETRIQLDLTNSLVSIDITELGAGFNVDLDNLPLDRNIGRFEGRGNDNYGTVGQITGSIAGRSGIIGVLYNTVTPNRGSYFATPQ
ncbi:MAG: hypothetical protein MJE68_07420 [Proteobacteria bacterium]|nr:hypothetical protein [Pseudomonadota bacterium]